jgi:hypothetical protein
MCIYFWKLNVVIIYKLYFRTVKAVLKITVPNREHWKKKKKKTGGIGIMDWEALLGTPHLPC